MVSSANSQKNGFVIVDKDPGWTSHDVVARTRKILDTRKVGHSGTLDPPATGVLIIGVGKATRLLKFITDLPKRYTATMVLGTETSTLDAEGQVTFTQDPSGITLEALKSAASQYTGEILQIPPMVSAVKVNGKRLYELAREGKSIEREPRTIHIHNLTIESTPEEHVYELSVACGSGTYVRSLVSDIARSAGAVAHVGTLRRNAIGSFVESEADPIEGIKLIGMAEGLRDYPRVSVNSKDAALVNVGKVFDKDHFALEDSAGPWAFTDQQGELLAVYKPHRGNTVKPDVVIPSD